MVDEFTKPRVTHGESLRFTAYAYAKLLWMRDRGNTEVAGFCITGTDNPLLVTDFKLIKQECTGATFDLDTGDLADYQDEMLDSGLAVWQSSRILAHTHPGNSAQPSIIDEENFKNAFATPDWAIMLIVAEGGQTYCRLKLNIGPGCTKQLQVSIDFSQEFRGSNHKEWEDEYKSKVSEKKNIFRVSGKEKIDWSDYLLFDRESNIDDGLDDLDCYWNQDGNVEYWDDQSGEWYWYDPLNKKWYLLDSDDERVIDIDMSDSEAAAKVIKWADKYANERELIMEK